MSVVADVRYFLRSSTSLHWAAWNDEYVVFDEASGHTHQLDAIRAYVLHLLCEEPRSFSEVRDALAALPDLTAFFGGSPANEILAAVFAEFETCGLVEVSVL
jgi:PqqD family protein of HPr-rel-A system